MKLIKANKSHIKDIWFLRNEPLTRKMSLNSEPISWEEHNNWLKKNLNNKDMIIYVAEIDKNSLGYLRFEKKISEQETYFVSISISSKYHGSGYGTYLLHNGIIKFFEEKKNINKLIAVIKKDNLKSKKLFLRQNFKKESETEYEITYGLKRGKD